MTINWLKNEFILWKLNPIHVKILNEISCSLNWIEIKLNSDLIGLNSNSINNWIKIHLKKNGMQIDENGFDNLLMNMMFKKKR
jgi:hypothetical protein